MIADPALAPTSRLARLLPGLALFRHYPRDALPGDLVAGASACVVMIPSVIAYSDLVGVPTVAGLYAALGAMLAYALLGSGTRIIAGPDAAIALIAGAAIVPLAGIDPVRSAALASALALGAGALLMVAARLNFGAIADLLSKPVLVGYMNGAALILIGTQLGKLLGVTLTHDAFFERAYEAARELPNAHLPTAALGGALIALLLVLKRVAPAIPGALVACALALGLAQAMNLDAWGIALLGAMPQGLPVPTVPDVSFRDLQALAPAALGIAFMVFSEGVLLARAFAAKHREDVDANRELLALGAGNVAAGALGGFAVTASQSRTTIVDAAGGRTQLAQWTAAVILVLFLLFLAPVLAKLPSVALAAILVVAGFTLFDAGEVIQLWRVEPRGFNVCIAVTLAVLIGGVIPGILFGVVLSLMGLLLSIARPRDAILKRIAGDHRYHDLEEDQKGDCPAGVLIYRLYAPLIFANARHVVTRVKGLVAAAPDPVRCVVFDLQAVTTMDITAVETFGELCAELTDAGIDYRIAHANRPLREKLMRVGATQTMGAERFFHATWEAVEDWVERGAKGLPPGPHAAH